MKKLYLFFRSNKDPKVFIKIIISIVVLLVSYHGIMWNLFTKELLHTECPQYVGDLARMSYQPNSVYLRKCNDYTLEKKHTEFSYVKKGNYDILTFGDSFSNGVTQGKNQYYQDYIIKDYNKTVINVANVKLTLNYTDTILALLNTKILEDLNIKMIVIESIERYAVQRFTTPIKWNNNISRASFEKQLSLEVRNKKKSTITFINNGNYKVISNYLLYSIKDKPFKNTNVYVSTLNENLFSVTNANKLLHYREDTQNIPYSNQYSINNLNDNLNHLANILKVHNIKLVFMPVVDKYNLYSPYISNNTFPKSNFFELLTPLTKQYYFVNTKQILSKLLPKEKDIFYADDTHWTNKASQEVVKSIPFDKLLNN